MKFLSLIWLAIFIFTFVGFTQEEATKPEQQGEGNAAAAIEEAAADTVNVPCTGCSMKMDKAKMVTLEKDGKIYYFCSEECKQNYLSKKEGYEKVKKEKKKECDKPKKE